MPAPTVLLSITFDHDEATPEIALQAAEQAAQMLNATAGTRGVHVEVLGLMQGGPQHLNGEIGAVVVGSGGPVI
jgi:hypothetical protein